MPSARLPRAALPNRLELAQLVYRMHLPSLRALAVLLALAGCGSKGSADPRAGGGGASSSSASTMAATIASTTGAIASSGTGAPTGLSVSLVAETQPGQAPARVTLKNEVEGLYITLKIGQTKIASVPTGVTSAPRLFASADVRAEIEIGTCPPPPEPGTCVFFKPKNVSGPNVLVPGKQYHFTVSGTKKDMPVVIAEQTSEGFLGLRTWTKPSLPNATELLVDVVGAAEALPFGVFFDVPTDYEIVATGASPKVALARVRLIDNGKELVAEMPTTLTGALGFTAVVDFVPATGAIATQALK
jgi:hypothetical protein